MIFSDLHRKQTVFFNSQQTKDVKFRIQKLKALKKNILNNEKKIIEALRSDFYKSHFETLSSEIGVVIDELNLHIRKLHSWQKNKNIFPALVNFPSRAKIYRQAYGKVLILSPWNYPFNLSMVPLIGAVSAGNTVVLKPSEYSPATSRIISEIISKVFDENYVKVVQGDAKTAQELLSLKWDYIFFTGSISVGKYIYQAAAKHLTPLTLELGGKSPVVIDHTADLDLAAKRIVWGKFLNAGQTCIAPDYILIPGELIDLFIEKLVNQIIKTYGRDIRNNPYFPRIINIKNHRRLLRILEGQNVVFGGEYDTENLFLSPSIVKNPDLDSELMQYEIFGPVLPVIAYDSRQEMEQILQQHPDPLAFYIFSKDKQLQKHFISTYRFGGGVINDTIIHFINNRLPFGGVGESGSGRYHGKHSFDTFTYQKSVVKRATWLDIPIRYLPPSQWKEKLIRLFLMKL
jgi:aldehyde dehydrogenase (NAD+)